jgi:hypothetical protein
MSAPIFLAADSKLSVECARIRADDIAAQDTEPLSRLYQFFVRKRSDKFAVSGLVEFTETNRVGHRNSRKEVAEEGEKILTW